MVTPSQKAVTTPALYRATKPYTDTAATCLAVCQCSPPYTVSLVVATLCAIIKTPTSRMVQGVIYRAKKHRRLAVLCLVAGCAPTGLSAQGVPIGDGSRVGIAAEQIAQRAEDAATQLAKLAEEEARAAEEVAKVAEMQTIYASLTGPSASVAAAKASPALQVTPPPGMTDAATRLFGKPRASLESKIVAVAAEYASRQGVVRVGLSAFEWRALFQALVKAESAFNPTAQSHVGAYGLTQLMPGTASDMGVDRYNTVDNLRGGAKYLSIQLNSFGRVDHALAAYNAGPGNVQRYGGIPPFKETQKYVPRILGYAAEYGALISGASTTGDVDESDLAGGTVGWLAEGLAQYADELLAEADATGERMAAILQASQVAAGLKDSEDLNSMAKAELAKMLALWSKARAAKAEVQAMSTLYIAQQLDLSLAFLDFRRKEIR